jgi:hypothetical protein
MARIGCFLAIGWLVLVGVEGLTLMYTSSCNSDACTGWWWLAIVAVAPTVFAGLILVPIGLASARALAKDRERAESEPPQAHP